MGTTSMFYLQATDYETIKSNCSLFVALAPVVDLTYTSSPLLKLTLKMYKTLMWLNETYDLNSMFSYNEDVRKLVSSIAGYFPELIY